MLFALAVPFTIANAAEWRIAGDYDVAFTSTDGTNYTATIPSVKEGKSFYIIYDDIEYGSTTGGSIELGYSYMIGQRSSYAAHNFVAGKDYSELIVNLQAGGYWSYVTITEGAGGGSDVEEETFTWSFSGKGSTWALSDEDGDGVYSATGISISDENYDGDYCITATGSKGTITTYGYKNETIKEDSDIKLEDIYSKIIFGKNYDNISVNWTPSSKTFSFSVETTGENPGTDPEPGTDGTMLVIYDANDTDSVKETVVFTANADGSYTANVDKISKGESFKITIDGVPYGCFAYQAYSVNDDSKTFDINQGPNSISFEKSVSDVSFTLTYDSMWTKWTVALSWSDNAGEEQPVTWSLDSNSGDSFNLAQDGDSFTTTIENVSKDTLYHIVKTQGNDKTYYANGSFNFSLSEQNHDYNFAESEYYFQFDKDYKSVSITWKPSTNGGSFSFIGEEAVVIPDPLPEGWSLASVDRKVSYSLEEEKEGVYSAIAENISKDLAYQIVYTESGYYTSYAFNLGQISISADDPKTFSICNESFKFDKDYDAIKVTWQPNANGGGTFKYSTNLEEDVDPALNRDIKLVIYDDADAVKETLPFTENEGIYTLEDVKKVYNGESFRLLVDNDKYYGCSAATVSKQNTDFTLYNSPGYTYPAVGFSMNLTNPIFTVKYDDLNSTWHVSLTWDIKNVVDTTQLSSEVAGGSGSRNPESGDNEYAFKIPFTLDEDFNNPDWFDNFNVELSLADEYAHLADHKAWKDPTHSGKMIRDGGSNNGYIGVNAYYAGVYNLKVSHPGVDDLFESAEHTMTLTVKPTIESLGLIVNFAPVEKTKDGYKLEYTPEFKFREDRDNTPGLEPDWNHNKVLFEVGSGYVGDPVVYDPNDSRFYWAHRDECQEAQKEANVKFYYSYSRNPGIQPRDTQNAPGVVPQGYTLSQEDDYMDLAKALSTSNGFSLIVEENGIQSDPQWIEMGGITTGIGAISSDADADVVWYDLQGNRVAAPAHGIYIRVQGSDHSKVLIP